MKTRITILAIVIVVFAVDRFSQLVHAGPNGMDDLIVVDHQPTQVGGLSSDTEFLTMFGIPSWQRGADDFILSSHANIEAIRWWGFYDQDNAPVQETFRIRLYNSRLLDGLPDDTEIVSENFINTPTRTATGRRIIAGVDPREYVFDYTLPSVVSLSAQTRFWLEIVQTEDLSTHFRWEFSQTDSNGHAFINATTGDWRRTTLTSDTAFQLIVIPEPSVFALLIFTTCLLSLRRYSLPTADALRRIKRRNLIRKLVECGSHSVGN